MADEKILYNGLTSIERGKQHQAALKAGRQAIEAKGYRQVTALVVAAVMSDGSVVLHGSGPVQAVEEMARLIYWKASEQDGK